MLLGVLIFATFLLQLSMYVSCETCSLHYRNVSKDRTHLLERLSAYHGQRFTTTSGTSTYSVMICDNVSKDHPNASAIVSNDNGKNVTVIGRLNDTHIVGGLNWMMLTYASGDPVRNSDYCHNSMKTVIVMTCYYDYDNDDEAYMVLNEDDSLDDCQVTFTLRTVLACSHPRMMSYGTLFCILLVTMIVMYIMVGIAYRRIIAGAQGRQQIPHYTFWRELGNLQADGCDFVCRKGMVRNEPWNRITNNFNDPADEPLLHP